LDYLKDTLKKINNIKIKDYPVVVSIFALLFIIGFISFFVMIEFGIDFRLVPHPFGLILFIFCVCFGLFFSAFLVYFIFWKPKK